MIAWKRGKPVIWSVAYQEHGPRSMCDLHSDLSHDVVSASLINFNLREKGRKTEEKKLWCTVGWSLRACSSYVIYSPKYVRLIFSDELGAIMDSPPQHPLLPRYIIHRIPGVQWNLHSPLAFKTRHSFDKGDRRVKTSSEPSLVDKGIAYYSI